MGGSGSGRRWRCGSKHTTNEYLKLCISGLLRSGQLEPGTASTIHWAPRGKCVRKARIEAEDDVIFLRYTYQGRHDPQPREHVHSVSLDWTPCNFGGKRPWFRCPRQECNRRVSSLYGGAEFACRYCHRLAYESQRENVSDRQARRADRIRKRLRWEVGIMNPERGRPRGMHWKTYERLMAEYHSLVHSSWRIYAQKFGWLD